LRASDQSALWKQSTLLAHGAFIKVNPWPFVCMCSYGLARVVPKKKIAG